MPRLRWLTGPLLVLACGCAADCTAVDCVAPITIRWTESEIPGVDRAQVCVDDACNDVAVIPLAGGGMVWASGGGREVRVRLVTTSKDGSVVAEVSGQGRKTNTSCCESVMFGVRGDALAVSP